VAMLMGVSFGDACRGKYCTKYFALQ
jgi:hypothetical protein